MDVCKSFMIPDTTNATFFSFFLDQWDGHCDCIAFRGIKCRLIVSTIIFL